jgi:hypothetical protein
MGENRALAAVARQAGIAEGQLSELRREVLEAAVAASCSSSAQHTQAKTTPLSLLPESGQEEEEEMGAGLGGRVSALAAALRRAEAARAREQAEAQAAVGALRKGLRAVGEKAVEAARVQVCT